ncbi:MAG: helix-turn-helix domain-containing protein [Methylocystis sp.]|uniref:helix-turn-helix domain-containing protein n=1 Tax=Methylocystis sp. TaxID=1911079 RepID=UPI003DA6A367
MIAVHLEPRGLKPDAKPVADFGRVASDKDNAATGSQRLLIAILTAAGTPPPEKPRLVTQEVKPRRIRDYIFINAEQPIAHIQRIVAKFYGIDLIEMTSRRRALEYSRPRQVAMYLTAKTTPQSLPAIGRRFERDHTTVLHAIRRIESLMARDLAFAADVARLREALS